jgi:hypothetical protein
MAGDRSTSGVSSKPLSARARTLRRALELLLVYLAYVGLAWAFQRRLLYPARGRVDDAAGFRAESWHGRSGAPWTSSISLPRWAA